MYLDSTPKFSIRERVGEFIAGRQYREKRNLLERELMLDRRTGLANRAAFDKARASAEADDDAFFIVFDCNNFGLVNKTLGHAYGDEVLYVIASEIKRAAKANRARAFRFGGDEFVVLCDRRRAEYLRDEIERRVGEFDFDTFKVSISGCIARTFEKADQFLQTRKAKRKGNL